LDFVSPHKIYLQLDYISLQYPLLVPITSHQTSNLFGGRISYTSVLYVNSSNLGVSFVKINIYTNKNHHCSSSVRPRFNEKQKKNGGTKRKIRCIINTFNRPKKKSITKPSITSPNIELKRIVRHYLLPKHIYLIYIDMS